jgi:cell filamentation protein
MNKDKDRYDTSELIEGQFEPGSDRRVLKNLLGIKRKREIGQIETRELLRALDELVDIYGEDHRFRSADIRRMHGLWLGNVYAWAGSYRQVNLSKDNFPFAAAAHIPMLMAEFEQAPLRQFTPCHFGNVSELAFALAVVHVELVLIHPFRDGNGRVARMLSILMGLQAGLPPLDFGDIKGKKKKEYFSALQAGLDRNYELMERIFTDVIGRTLRIHGR